MPYRTNEYVEEDLDLEKELYEIAERNIHKTRRGTLGTSNWFDIKLSKNYQITIFSWGAIVHYKSSKINSYKNKELWEGLYQKIEQYHLQQKEKETKEKLWAIINKHKKKRTYPSFVDVEHEKFLDKMKFMDYALYFLLSSWIISLAFVYFFFY